MVNPLEALQQQATANAQALAGLAGALQQIVANRPVLAQVQQMAAAAEPGKTALYNALGQAESQTNALDAPKSQIMSRIDALASRVEAVQDDLESIPEQAVATFRQEVPGIVLPCVNQTFYQYRMGLKAQLDSLRAQAFAAATHPAFPGKSVSAIIQDCANMRAGWPDRLANVTDRIMVPVLWMQVGGQPGQAPIRGIVSGLMGNDPGGFGGQLHRRIYSRVGAGSLKSILTNYKIETEQKVKELHVVRNVVKENGIFDAGRITWDLKQSSRGPHTLWGIPCGTYASSELVEQKTKAALSSASTWLMRLAQGISMLEAELHAVFHPGDWADLQPYPFVAGETNANIDDLEYMKRIEAGSQGTSFISRLTGNMLPKTIGGHVVPPELSAMQIVEVASSIASLTGQTSADTALPDYGPLDIRQYALAELDYNKFWVRPITWHGAALGAPGFVQDRIVYYNGYLIPAAAVINFDGTVYLNGMPWVSPFPQPGSPRNELVWKGYYVDLYHNQLAGISVPATKNDTVVMNGKANGVLLQALYVSESGYILQAWPILLRPGESKTIKASDYVPVSNPARFAQSIWVYKPVPDLTAAERTYGGL